MKRAQLGPTATFTWLNSTALFGKPAAHQWSSIGSTGACLSSAKLWLYGLYSILTGCNCGGPGLASLAHAPCRYTVNMKVIFLTSCLFFRPYAAQVRLTGLFIEDYFYLGECGDISWQQGQFPPIFGRFLAVFGQLHYVIGQVRIRTPILTHPAVMMSLTNPWFWCIDVTSLVTNTDQWSQQLSKPAVFNTHG